MMKKKIMILLTSLGILGLAGCQASTSVSLTYDVLDEQIKVKLNTTEGFKLSNSGNQFEVKDKDGNVISTGMFSDETTYVYYKNIVMSDPQEYSVKENEINGSDCLYYTINGEYNHLVDIPDSNVYIIIGSVANESDAKDVMKSLTFESVD